MSQELLFPEDSGSGKDKKVRKQRPDVQKLLKRTQDLVKKQSNEDLDRIIDLGLLLHKSKLGFEMLFGTNPTEWRPLFPLEFYRQIYRLNRWSTEGKKLFERPGIIGTWTNWMIYIRFPEGTIKWLREHRGFRGGMKFHQFSSNTGRAEIIKFIDSATDLMSKCKNWNQFKRLLAKGYGKTYQESMFDHDDINWKPQF